MDRREFVIAGSLAAAAPSIQWLRSGGMFSAAAVPGPGPVSGAANAVDVFAGLVRAVLPFDDPRFAAIAPATIEANANALFALDLDIAVAQNLALFDDLRQFQAPPASLMSAEQALYPVEDSEKSIPAPFAARQAHDLKLYQSFRSKLAQSPTTFTELGLADQRAYLLLWAHSALGTRRRFYQSTKTLIMAATYSLDAVWPIIGYAGPLLHLPKT